ncbi:MAG: VWA domain-containing protein [Acidobacteriia bacterium]|nr:VWA domain-containing protein [Terriglobia bacterium]
MIRLFRAAPVVLLCACAIAQQTGSNDSVPTFRSRVELVMVPVVVRDKNGHSVGDLRKEDFQLFDQGRPRDISRFSIEKSADRPVVSVGPSAGPGGSNSRERPATPPASIPTRFVAYVFDDVHAEAADLADARNAADKHIKETLRSTDRAAIFTTSGLGMLDFTSDLAKIHDALFALQPRSRQLGQTECPTMTYYQADLIQNKHDQAALDLATDEAMVCSDNPDRKTAMMQARAVAGRTLVTGDMETHTTLSLLRDLVRRLSAAPGQRSLILASPGFLITDDYRRDESELMERAIRANVIVSAVDARGLYVIFPGDDLSQRISASTALAKAEYQRASALATEGTLAELADATGGGFYHNNNDLVEGFRRVDARPEYIYILGFSPQDLKLDGKFHALRVTIRNSGRSDGYQLQVRRGYYAPKPADSVEQAKRDIREALLSRDELHDIPVDLETQVTKSHANSAALVVVARVDVRALHYQRVNGRNVDTLTIVAGVFDRDGRLINSAEKNIDMKLEDKILAMRAPSGIGFKAGFDLTPGKYVVRLVVRDSEGQMMAARNGAVDIP